MRNPVDKYLAEVAAVAAAQAAAVQTGTLDAAGTHGLSQATPAAAAAGE